ncbi:MAG: hypothetical protein J1G05_03050 [Clostridiales bacterium]|nr:hypothetical protein [Clostridiales bacterium]
MSGKSILLSILSVVLFIGVVFIIAFAISVNFLFGILALFLMIIPAALQRKALSSSRGIIDRLIAKIIVPILFVVIAFIAIFGVAFWMDLFG